VFRRELDLEQRQDAVAPLSAAGIIGGADRPQRFLWRRIHRELRNRHDLSGLGLGRIYPPPNLQGDHGGAARDVGERHRNVPERPGLTYGAESVVATSSVDVTLAPRSSAHRA
jgi:hypothetical protein